MLYQMDLPARTPACVGIILDGNRRWAKEKGLPTLMGHQKGADNVETIARHIFSQGISHVVVYAFSTENWKRSEEEVSYLMGLIHASKDLLGRIAQEGVRVRFIGERARLPQSALEAVEMIEESSEANTGKTLWICLSYGGRAEIVAAMVEMQKEQSVITEEVLRDHLWTAGMPDPDVIIRTGGAERLSNFLLWQAAYSELFFVDTYWPDFSTADFDHILEEYGARERRHGK